jgi:hypothetical protein
MDHSFSFSYLIWRCFIFTLFLYLFYVISFFSSYFCSRLLHSQKLTRMFESIIANCRFSLVVSFVIFKSFSMRCAVNSKFYELLLHCILIGPSVKLLLFSLYFIFYICFVLFIFSIKQNLYKLLSCL